jgi:hypothetical protein
MEEQRQEAVEIPQHSLRINLKKTAVICRVALHRIPEKCIKFEPTSTNLYVDTLKFSRKYLLKVNYPNGVIVDANNAEATLEYGILTARLPILHSPGADSEDLGIESKHDENIDYSAKKRKREQMKNASVCFNKTKVNGESLKKAKQKSKTSKNSVESPAGNKAGESIPQKKRLLDNKNVALSIVEEVNANQDQKIQEKLQKQWEKVSTEVKRKRAKTQQKMLKKKQRESIVKHLENKQHEGVTTSHQKPNVGKKRVSFSSATVFDTTTKKSKQVNLKDK